MTSVHTVRPTDLVALVSFDGRVYPNEAVTRDRIGAETSPRPLEAALEQWFSFATGRHTWISVKGATLRGLVSARRRGSRAAWEVDCLVDAAEDDSSVLMSLLDRLTVDAGRARAEKVFLRVASDSPVIETASRCGFTPYRTEMLMAATGRGGPRPATKANGRAAGASGGLRRWGRSDAYDTFRLYNRWTPEPVRRVEAATFREWLAARERLSSQRSTRQQVYEDGGRIVGWLRFAADTEVGRFDLMSAPESPDVMEKLVTAAHARLHEQSSLFTLVPDFAQGLRAQLQQFGFADSGEFAVLARLTTRPVRVSELAPAAPAQTPSS